MTGTLIDPTPQCDALNPRFGSRCDLPADHEGAHFHRLTNGDAIGWGMPS